MTLEKQSRRPGWRRVKAQARPRSWTEANRPPRARRHSQVPAGVVTRSSWARLSDWAYRRCCSCGWGAAGRKRTLALCCLELLGSKWINLNLLRPHNKKTPGQPAQLRPRNALPDMECLFNIFSVTVTLHANDILHNYTRYLACWQLPIILFESRFSEIHVFKFNFVAHEYSWVISS